ncbi:MAG TPA: tRNA (adenosine(37)-N6)-dimethylallyltransferase MiaA [Candidatus Saccharibacteria bacterium]|nr:tRNA (adenosine(37)-N6)-dimethylallyltransferase MiaA [Candidatus Saccharibacteria bacterium]
MAAVAGTDIPLIVITGPTASGKSALAIKLAKRWGGEIICADSRTVYRGMDIGTAKPTVDDRSKVRHWLLDVVAPGERFSVADFQRIAREAIADIRARGKVPFLVGGTGLYIDALILDFQLGGEADMRHREMLSKLSISQLQMMIKNQHISLPENSRNKRYLIRCIEKNNTAQQGKKKPDSHTLVIAIDTDKTLLRQRISERAVQMLQQGVVQETQRLLSKYDSDSEAMSGNIYPLIQSYLLGEFSQEELIQKFIIRDWRLAKRQMTWLRRHDYVEWCSLGLAEKRVDSFLRSYGDA